MAGDNPVEERKQIGFGSSEEAVGRGRCEQLQQLWGAGLAVEVWTAENKSNAV